MRNLGYSLNVYCTKNGGWPSIAPPPRVQLNTQAGMDSPVESGHERKQLGPLADHHVGHLEQQIWKWEQQARRRHSGFWTVADFHFP